MSRLVLSRKAKQGVTIHKNGEVVVNLEVHKIDRNAVTIAFVADAEIKIDRDEIYEQKPHIYKPKY